MSYQITQQQQQQAAQYFGAGVGAYVLQPLAAMGEGGGYPAAQALEVNESNIKTVLGAPVFMPVIVPEFTYAARDSAGRQVTKTFARFAFPATTLVDISMSKNIALTPIQGRAGTVKELISNGDYTVRLRGFVVGAELYPREGVQRLIELANVPAAFRVENDLFHWLGINNLVVQDFDLSAVEGYENTQAFELRCLSDDTVSVQLSEAAKSKYEGLL